MCFRNFPCNLLGEIQKFLEREIEEEKRYVLLSKPISTYSLDSIKKDDFYYTWLEPNEDLSKFDDGTWVKITKSGFSCYGSLWLTEDGKPYLLTGEPLPKGLLQIVEADGLQLMEMQKQAFSTLQKKSSIQAMKINEIIFGYYKDESQRVSSHVNFYDSRITKNSSQKASVLKALAVSDNESFFLIHGPPGTGKTTVITEIVKHLVAKNKKVLITSHTNVAVNNVMETLACDASLREKMVRLGPKAKVSKVLKDLVPTHENELLKLAIAPVIGATLSKLSILVLNGKLSFDKPYFDTVIVDESSMASIPLTLAGIIHGKSFILVGDHKQLPPITKTNFPESCPNSWKCGKICESLFRLLIELHPNKSETLNLQFRSHPHIVGFSQKYIYMGKIQSATECFAQKLDINPIDREQVPGTINDRPICYVNMCYDRNPIEWFPKGPQITQRRKTPSCFNELEAAVAIKIRHDLIKAGIHPERIWIITPFRIQREIIRNAIKKIYGAVPKDTVISIYEQLLASTVDAIQGKENDVIIYSLTWVPSETRVIDLHPALRDIRRLNVALTRARKKLIVIGQLDWLSITNSQGPNVYELLEEYMQSHRAEVMAPSISGNDDFLKVVRFCFKKKKNEEIPAFFDEDVRQAIQRIRKELGLDQQPKKWIIRNEEEFQEFRENGFWHQLKYASKIKIYDLRVRGIPLEISYIYDRQKQRGEAFIKIYDPYGRESMEPLELES
ncbi:MAG: AAA domain-containing protein [Candidatus Bathyarchaeales archaeon]